MNRTLRRLSKDKRLGTLRRISEHADPLIVRLVETPGLEGRLSVFSGQYYNIIKWNIADLIEILEGQTPVPKREEAEALVLGIASVISETRRLIAEVVCIGEPAQKLLTLKDIDEVGRFLEEVLHCLGQRWWPRRWFSL